MFNKYQRKLCFALEDTTPTTQIVAKYIRSASLFQECFCRRRKRSADIIRRISRTLFFCCFFLSRWFPRMSACSVWAKIYACGYSFINGHSCKMFFFYARALVGLASSLFKNKRWMFSSIIYILWDRCMAALECYALPHRPKCHFHDCRIRNYYILCGIHESKSNALWYLSRNLKIKAWFFWILWLVFILLLTERCTEYTINVIEHLVQHLVHTHLVCKLWHTAHSLFIYTFCMILTNKHTLTHSEINLKTTATTPTHIHTYQNEIAKFLHRFCSCPRHRCDSQATASENGRNDCVSEHKHTTLVNSRACFPVAQATGGREKKINSLAHTIAQERCTIALCHGAGTCDGGTVDGIANGTYARIKLVNDWRWKHTVVMLAFACLAACCAWSGGAWTMVVLLRDWQEQYKSVAVALLVSIPTDCLLVVRWGNQ